MKWYVAQVTPGMDIAVRYKLQLKAFDARVITERQPIHRKGEWTVQDRLVMPGYVFIGLDELKPEQYHAIKRIPNVLRLLGHPTPISDQEAVFWGLSGPDLPLEPSVLAIDSKGTPKVLSGPLLDHARDIAWINKRQCRAGVRVKTPDGEKVVKFSIIVMQVPDSWIDPNEEAEAKTGSIHSPAEAAADIAGEPGTVCPDGAAYALKTHDGSENAPYPF